jgi:tRNA modification GTPase
VGGIAEVSGRTLTRFFLLEVRISIAAMPLDLDDTIVALASPAGSALRGIVRASGENTAEIIDRLFRPDEQSLPWRHTRLPRRFTGHLDLASIMVPVPVALMYWPTRRSYTGQPMAEFHLNGSMPLVEATLEHLCENGARLARRGEFTMRAFLSGRIDLLQAEAVLGVIEAADHDELQKALSQLGGRMTSRLRQLRCDLIALLGDLEAGLDFVEEDIEFITKSEINRRLDEALTLLNELFAVSAGRLPTGYRRRIVLAGLPNAGKSTLFNRLTGRQNAIVSPIAGTTRDYLTASLKIGSLEVELIDTAGWEDAANLIEQRAQELRTEQVAASDLVVWCTAVDIAESDRIADDELILAASRQCPGIIRVLTRCDVEADVARTESRSLSEMPLRVSGVTGMGLDSLRSDMLRRLTASQFARSELLSTTAVRCRDSLRQTIQSLEQARLVSRELGGDELIALEIRRALLELGTMLGEVYTDDILDHIFSNFCIGK